MTSRTSISPPPSPDLEPRFGFGRNWRNFLAQIDDNRINSAVESMQALLGTETLQGKRFLDAGSGSGLFSLAANRLGAEVVSFDFDRDSVSCTQTLKDRFADPGRSWEVRQGSLLDSGFLESLGQFDVIYCWGVAHHTGHMWQALDNLLQRAAPGALVVLAIYNDQDVLTRVWIAIKKLYQKLPAWLRPVYVLAIFSYGFLKRALVSLLAATVRLVTLRNPFVPFVNWANEKRARGMSWWHDLVDWVGGWPFEAAKPEAVFRFMRNRGFELRELKTLDGHGCNEFVFERGRGPERRSNQSAG